MSPTTRALPGPRNVISSAPADITTSKLTPYTPTSGANPASHESIWL